TRLTHRLAKRVHQHAFGFAPADALGRIVADHAYAAPLERKGAGQDFVDERRRTYRGEVRICRALPSVRGTAGAEQRAGAALGLRQYAGSGISGKAGPVAVEVLRNLGDHRTDREHVEVGEDEAVGRSKVLVADVA